jgi:hypothetical protein
VVLREDTAAQLRLRINTLLRNVKTSLLLDYVATLGRRIDFSAHGVWWKGIRATENLISLRHTSTHTLHTIEI